MFGINQIHNETGIRASQVSEQERLALSRCGQYILQDQQKQANGDQPGNAAFERFPYHIRPELRIAGNAVRLPEKGSREVGCWYEHTNMYQYTACIGNFSMCQ